MQKNEIKKYIYDEIIFKRAVREVESRMMHYELTYIAKGIKPKADKALLKVFKECGEYYENTFYLLSYSMADEISQKLVELREWFLAMKDAIK